MTPEAVISMFRSEFGDATAPHFWSDDEILVYLNEAHRIFVRGTGGIPDVITVDYTADTPFSPLPSNVVKIKKAYHPDDAVPLRVLNIDELETTGVDYRTDNVDYRPRQMITGLKKGQVRWMPIPDQDGTVELAIMRQTTSVITKANLNDATVFEIDEEYHRKLVYGIAFQAMLKHDAETFDERKASDLREQFYGEIAAALNDRQKQEYNPRTVQYGDLDVGGAYDWGQQRW